MNRNIPSESSFIFEIFNATSLSIAVLPGCMYEITVTVIFDSLTSTSEAVTMNSS